MRIYHKAVSTLLMTAALVLMPAFAGAQTNQATIYKWTDAQGVVHFSMQPPADPAVDVRVQKKTRTEPAEADGSPAAANPVPAQAAAATPEAKPEPKKDPAICARARANLEQLQNRRYVTVRDEYGEERILDEEAVATEIERAQKAVANNCE